MIDEESEKLLCDEDRGSMMRCCPSFRENFDDDDDEEKKRGGKEEERFCCHFASGHFPRPVLSISIPLVYVAEKRGKQQYY